MTVLVTGGAGYVGSHVVADLLARGDDVVVVDDLSRGAREAVACAETVARRRAVLEVGDLCDRAFLDRVFAAHDVAAVVHCAAYKAVAESVAHPERYERNNVEATRSLTQAMARAGVMRIVFSSSGAVYGDADDRPIGEDATLAPMSPYADTKARCEPIVAAVPYAVSLRFFNVCGAHPSAALGEFGEGSTNLMPVVLGQLDSLRPRVTVFGGDHGTPDGTCVRDYVHVCDVSAANLAALGCPPGHHVYNVGTGRGASVLDVVEAVRRASGRDIEVVIGDRRPGDPAAVVADVSKARRELGFESRYALPDMVRTALAWVSAR